MQTTSEKCSVQRWMFFQEIFWMRGFSLHLLVTKLGSRNTKERGPFTSTPSIHSLEANLKTFTKRTPPSKSSLATQTESKTFLSVNGEYYTKNKCKKTRKTTMRGSIMPDWKK